MSKRKFSAGWYAGSVREAKRAAYLAGAEAALDVVMKIMDGQAKTLLREKTDQTPAQRVVSLSVASMMVDMSRKLYEGVIDRALSKTPFDQPTEDMQLLERERDPVTEREPGTADREV